VPLPCPIRAIPAGLSSLVRGMAKTKSLVKSEGMPAETRGPEVDDLARDARQLLHELDLAIPEAAQATGECRPSLDVVDTTEAIEVVVDLPGVPANAIRVCVRHNRVLVVGAKVVTPSPPDSRYHVAERSSGKFARGVRLTGAVDTSRARAVLSAGLLRVILPRAEERRGRLFTIPVDTA